MKSKKRSKLVWLLILVLFIPLVIIGLIVKQNLDSTMSSGKVTKIVIMHGEQEAVVSDQEKGAFLVSVVQNGVRVDEPAHSLDEYEKCSVAFHKLKNIFTYTFYLTSSAKDCLYTDETNALFRIPTETATELLAMPEIGELVIRYSVPPAAVFNAGKKSYTATVTTGNWVYRKADSTVLTEEVNKEGGEKSVLPLGVAPTLSFPVQPDFCSVKLTTVADELLFTGTPEELSSFTYTKDEELVMTVFCDWYEDDNKNYYGALEYRFLVFFDAPTVLVINQTSVAPGGCFIIRIEDSTSESIAVTASFPTGYSDVIDCGAYKTALVPVGTEVKPSDYSITLLGSDVEETIPVIVNAGTVETIPVGAASNAAYQDFSAQFAALQADKVKTKIWGEEGFALPTSTETDCKIPYGAVLSTGNEAIPHLGIDLALTPGTPVLAAAAGKCVFAGETALLGNTVILDHGAGVFTVYGNLSSVEVRTGVVLPARQSVGKSGSGAVCAAESVHFGMAIGGVFVDPYRHIGSILAFS